MRILPQNQAFFDEFDRHTALIVTAADALAEMAQGAGGGGASPGSDLAARIKTLEEEGDAVVHRVIVDLRHTFITPLDRDDTHHLMSRLDDVLDQIEAAAYRLTLYRLPLPEKHLSALVNNVRSAAVVTHDAVACLRDRSGHDRALELCVEINKIENEADTNLRRALVELFSDGVDAVTLIKRKEIYETLEDATDRCEDVADAIENLLLDS